MQISGTLALTQPHTFHQGPSRQIAQRRVVRASVDWLDAETANSSRSYRDGRGGLKSSQVVSGRPQRLSSYPTALEKSKSGQQHAAVGRYSVVCAVLHD